MVKKTIFSVLLVLPLATTASWTYGDGSQPVAAEAGAAEKNARGLLMANIHRGAQLFAQNCARCHGDKAEGAPNWHIPGADGKFPPPPLNGTAHTWHHPRAALAMQIRNGSKKIGGNMPAFGDKLAEQDISAVIDFLSSRWPDPIYEAWRRRETQN